MASPRADSAQHLEIIERHFDYAKDGVSSFAQSRLRNYIQNLDVAEIPQNSIYQQYHTGRVPNSRVIDGKPRLLLMGQRRSGKSSISSVVFHKTPPSDTLFLEATTKITKDQMHSFMDFQIWDFPGQVNYFDSAIDLDSLFGDIGAVIWVLDAQDEYLDAIARLNGTILHLQSTYPTINIEVFVHKVDGLSDEYRSDTFRDIIQRVQDELSDAGLENAPVNFYQTSIYDHSIFEAFSKVIQSLIPQLPTLQALLNSLCSTCQIQKAYLFDVLSKIYIATDTSPTDIGSYEVCSDYIDVIVDIGQIYGWDRPSENGHSVEDEESGNHYAESLITMERRGNNYLYLKEVNKYLALICLMGEDSPAEKKALIDYNVGVFEEALAQVFPR